MIKLSYDKQRVEQARDLRLRWYNGDKIERTPFVFTIRSEISGAWMQGCPYNFREVLSDPVKAVEGNILSIQHQLDSFPDCDYLPSMNLFYFGEGILASMYGAEQYIVEDNPPYTKGRIIKDIYETECLSNDFEIEDTEWGSRLKEHIQRFVDATDGEIPVNVADYQSPYGTATKLLPNEELMLAMYDAPELVHRLLDITTNGIIKLIDAMERWVGAERIARNIKNPIPGSCGVILWDDYISVLNPDLHTAFCAPYNKILFEKYGYGHLHTCGPYFPRFIEACLECEPRSMDISIMRGMGKTREDMLSLLKAASERDIRLFGSLASNDQSIFDSGAREPDDELMERFIGGGYMPMGEGSYEQGIKFKEMVGRIGGG